MKYAWYGTSHLRIIIIVVITIIVTSLRTHLCTAFFDYLF